MSNHDDGGFTIIGATPEIGADPNLQVVGVNLHQNEYEREIRSEPVQERRANDTLRDERDSTPISITLMKIDETIFKHLTDFIKPAVDEDGKQRLVPVRYANAERWKQVRDDGVLRDAAGRVQTPIILFRRTGIRRNPLTNPVNKHLDRTYQTGWNRNNVYDDFAARNHIIPPKKLISVTIPDYVDLTYDFLLWTDYLEQMNPLIESLNFEMDSYWGDRGEFKFRVYTEDYTIDTEVPAEGDRYVKATFQMKVSAYLLPDSVMTVDKGVQPTDRIRYSSKKVVIVQEIDGTGVAPRRVVERWPSLAGTELTSSIAEEVEAPAGPTGSFLPQTGSLQLYYDTTEQGNFAIIEDIQNAENMTRIGGGNFIYTASPPSVALAANVNARNVSVPTARIRLNDDGIQTMMLLLKPDNITNNQYVLDYGNNGNTVVLGFSGSFWEFIIGFGDAEPIGVDPRLGSQMPATASVFQTVCYTVGVDGLNKQNGYHNGKLSVGPISKSFDLVQPGPTTLDIGHVGTLNPFVGEFGAYLQWTTTLTAAEVAEAHNFLRDIDAGYGLPEA